MIGEGPGNALCILLPDPRSHPEVRFNEAQVMRVLFLRPPPATSPRGKNQEWIGRRQWECGRVDIVGFSFCVQGRMIFSVGAAFHL